MKIFSTKRMRGEKLEDVAEAKTSEELWSAISAFKEKHKDDMKVEPYNRFLFFAEEKKMVVDFGDYSVFLEIEFDGSDSDSKVFDSIMNPKVEK